VVAFVVAREGGAPSLEELRAHAADQLSAPQLPKQLVLVDSIPRTPGGKPLRRALRDAT
jgi:acyl-CoA synthetase (AMP-forming)/AMP-acid ligase II